MVSFLEGVSYLLLLGVGVPLKYLAGNEAWVKTLGMPHGIFFVAYIVLACVMLEIEKWGLKDFSIILIASLLPFGTFYVDWKYLRS